MDEATVPPDYELHPDVRAEIRAIARALPPLTDEQCKAIAATLDSIRLGPGARP